MFICAGGFTAFRLAITVCEFDWRGTGFVHLLVMLGPPKFDIARGGRALDPHHTFSFVPRERTQDTPGASSSSAGPLRLTRAPCASPPYDLTEDLRVAHIPVTNYTGDVVMY